MTKAKTKERAADAPVLFGDAEIKVPQSVAEPPPKKPIRNAVAKVERMPPPASSANMLSIIADAAANPKVDVEKMRALLQIQREIMAEEARVAFTQDFLAMSKDMPSVNRDGRIVIEAKPGKRGQVTPYATFENLHRVATPILRDHGFVFWSEPDIGNDSAPIVMRGHLDHVKGHGKTCAIPLPFETSGSKNNVQGVGSSLSYGRRYCMMNLCNIVSHAPDDRDVDGADPKQASKQEAADPKINGSQAKELLKAINECGVEATVFMDKYGIKAVHELPLRSYDEAIKACRDYAARKGKVNEQSNRG